MSGSFPISTAKFGTLGIKSVQNTIISKTVSGKRLVRQIDNQRFSFTVQIITAKRSDVYGDLMAFIMKQRSQKETFTITLPTGIGNAQGTIGGSPTGNASAGATSITIASGTGTLKAGDLIKFANHTKVYMVVSDHANCSTGTITIEPPLRTSISTQAITFDSVPMTVRLVSDLQEFPINEVDINGNFLFNFSFDVVEAL